MSSSLLLPKKKYHKFFRKSMALGEEPLCQKEKSSAKNRCRLGHNAGATKNRRKKHNSTTYVNYCNYSTPHIVEKRQMATDIL